MKFRDYYFLFLEKKIDLSLLKYHTLLSQYENYNLKELIKQKVYLVTLVVYEKPVIC